MDYGFRLWDIPENGGGMDLSSFFTDGRNNTIYTTDSTLASLFSFVSSVKVQVNLYSICQKAQNKVRKLVMGAQNEIINCSFQICS